MRGDIIMVKKKILAVNLPAYHQIPENDEWWGKGFTEWDNVRSGKPLFKGHYQPIVPKDRNYYDLSRKEDIVAQMKLAKKYNIYGFVYYHYWFGDGRMLFEKPAEMIRDEIDEDFHYCFCWANDTWKTTWHGMEPTTLMEQRYPGLEDWAKHYNYLKTFFADKRYIKIDNKPVIFVYKPNEIPNYDSMVDYWSKCCQEDGFDGIYMVEYISSKNRGLYSHKSSAVYEFEPLYTMFFDVTKFNLVKRFICKKLKKTDYQSYDFLWKSILNRTRTYEGTTIFKGGTSGWDNSARKGKESMVVKGKTPEKFRKYLNEFLNKQREDASDEYYVINAWNEWSEGAYLEPDEKDGYAYLEVIKDAVEKAEKS